MAMTPETQKMLMDTLRVSQPQSIAAPLSPFEQIEAQRGLLSTDPVVANLQKLGRGVVGFLNPETPLDYLTMGTPLGKAVKGGSKAVEKTSDVISDYMMAHRPFAGPRAHNLLEKVDGDSFSPDDIYQNARFYIGSTPRQKEYKETMEFMDFIKKNKGNPNAEVTIYRGSPNKELNKGDWITPSKEYAKMEAGGKGGQVFAHKVKLKDIRWDGNSLEEWGYFPTK